MKRMTKLLAAAVGAGVLACAGCVPQAPPAAEKPECDLEYDVAFLSLEKGNEISPLIYGEFLEHIPGCIYGVIWAELIEDRKFYYRPGEEGLSPWQTQGEVGADEECYSENGYAAILPEGAAIFQTVSLGAEMYDGYFYAKGEGTVRVQVGEFSEEIAVSGGFVKYAFSAVGAEGETEVRFSCTQGEIALDSLSLMPADNYMGMRRDTLDAMKSLAGTIYRWPGGNFVSGYQWKDGIGDRDRRPSRRNLAWFPDTDDVQDDIDRLETAGFYDRIEPNDMGTDEFLAMCEYIGAIPYMAVNTGSSSAEEAADLVEYCNGAADTEYGALRAGNGHESAYDIRYWCVGNEMQGDWQIGHTSIAEYVDVHNAFSEAMKEIDGDILITGCGDNCSEWTEQMFKNCAGNLDYIGEHLYAQSDDSYEPSLHILSMTNNLDMRIANHRRLIAEIPSAAHVKIAFDEFAYEWDGQSQLRDALGIAASLNLFIDNADVVGMANYSDAVFTESKSNAPGALYSSDRETYFSPVGYALKAYAQNMQAYSAEAVIRQTDKTTALDYALTVSADGKRATLAIVNPSSKSILLNLREDSRIVRKVSVAGTSATAANSADGDEVSYVVTENAAFAAIEPLSITLFVLEIG